MVDVEGNQQGQAVSFGGTFFPRGKYNGQCVQTLIAGVGETAPRRIRSLLLLFGATCCLRLQGDTILTWLLK
jgi:hypothetical protein